MKYTKRRALSHRLIISIGLVCVAAQGAHAAHPGDADPMFGQTGRVVTDFFGKSEQVFAVAPMQDGRAVAVGVVSAANASGPGGSENVAVARYLPNGMLDPDFASAGLFNLDIDGGPDRATAVKVLPDRSMLVGATLTTNAYSDFGIIKLRSDGSLDTTFGEASAGSSRKGFVRLDIGGASFHDEVFALAVQHDGCIIAAGRSRVVLANGQVYVRIAVARFTAHGEVDTTFGGSGTGYVVLSPTLSDDSSDYLTGIALDQAGNLATDDRIVLVGYTFARNNAFVARLTANGLLDTTFGGNGRVTIKAGNAGGVQTGVSTIAAARLAADGRIVVVGEGNDRGLAFLRFTAAGALDTTFGSNGRTLVKFSGSSDYDEPAALALQGNGKIVAAGYATNRATGAARRDFFVARLLANGVPDAGFGDGAGRAVVQVSNDDDEAFAVGIEMSGNVLVGGYQKGTGSNGGDFVLVRLIGDPDRIFANSFGQPFTF